MKGKIFKWTAALAVALTLAGGAAGLSPATVSLPDFSITAEAASHYSFDKQTNTITLNGKFTYNEKDVANALPKNYTLSAVKGLTVTKGSDITFPERLIYSLPNVEIVDFSEATITLDYEDISNNAWFLSELHQLKKAVFYQTTYNGSWHAMFKACENLEIADLEIKDGQEINSTYSLFEGCSSLKTIYLNNYFNTQNVDSMSKMFSGCSSLTSIPMEKINTSSVERMVSMFEGCSNLTSLDLSGLNAANITFDDYRNYEKMFLGCDKLATLKLPANFKVRGAMGLRMANDSCPEGLEGWAYSDDALTNVATNCVEPGFVPSSYYADLGNLTPPTEAYTLLRCSAWVETGSCYQEDKYNKVLNVFGNVSKNELRNLNDYKLIKKINFAEGTVFPSDSSSLFDDYQSLTEIDLKNVDTGKVTTMDWMFYNCYALKAFASCKIDTSKVTSMKGMFENCRSLETFMCNVSKTWDTKNVTNFERMFSNCTSLKRVVAEFVSDKIVSVKKMFNGCSQLYQISLYRYDFNLLGVSEENKADMFAGCSSLTMLNVSSQFGPITQSMKLRNDNGGWCEEYWNGIQVSGTAQYAEIDTTSSNDLAHASLFKTVSMNNRTFTISQYSTPVPGNMAYSDLVTCESSHYKIVESATGFYDAHSGKKLADQPYEPGGSYYLKIRLKPEYRYRFGTFTAADFEQIKFKFFVNYAYTDKKQFVDLRAANLTEDGYLDLYAVVDSGSGNTPIVQKAYYKKLELPEGTVQRYSDSFATQNVLPCYQLYNISFTPYAFSLAASTDLLSDAYLSYTGTSTDRYEFSIDGGAYQILESPRKTVGTGLLPGTQHNVKIRKKNSSITLAEKNVSTKAPNAPVAGGYLVDNVSHLETGFSRSMVITNCLGIVYYIPVSDLEGYENIKMIIQKETFNETGSECQIEITEVKDYTIETSQYGTEYVFAYDNIAAKEMGSNVYATLYAEKNGSSYIRKINKYSIADYAINQLNATKNPKFATLLADMLNYGAAAQVRFNYNTGNLVNERMSASHLNCLSDPDSLVLKSDSATAKISNPTARFSGKTLMLGNNVSIVYYMMFDSSVNTDNVVLQLDYKMITGQSVTERIPFSEFRLSGDYEGEYRYDFVKIRAKDAAQPVTAKIMVGNQQISNATTYSIQTYAKNMLENTNTQEKDRKIITALMLYCKSAESYFKSL